MVLFVANWIVCGILHFGLSNAYWRRAYPGSHTITDLRTDLVLSLLGPISLFVLLIWLVLGNGRGYKGFSWNMRIGE